MRVSSKFGALLAGSVCAVALIAPTSAAVPGAGQEVPASSDLSAANRSLIDSLPLGPAAGGSKVVYLTFDDGPSAYTAQVQSILRSHDAHATFFMIGYAAASHRDRARSLVNAGHAVGNHTWSHPYLTRLSTAGIASQLARARNVLPGGAGSCFRPPYGATNARVKRAAANAGYPHQVLWSVDPRDWSRPGANVIFNRVVSRVHNGSIVLLHDGGGNRVQTVAALRRLVPWLANHGYRMVSLPYCR